MSNENIYIKLYDFRVFNDANEEESEHNEFSDNTEFTIQMFGYNENNESCSIIVKDFKPYFYVKVGDNWNQSKKYRFFEHLKERIGKYYKESIIECKLLKRKKLYGFDTGKLYKFIEIKFNSILSFNKCKKLWYNERNKLSKNGYIFEEEQLYLYEANIPPLLRLFHIKNIHPSGWIMLPFDNTIINYHTITSCVHEYEINYKYIISCNTKENQVPLKICSFDIEASSSHGDFPIPIKSYKKLASQIIEYFENVKLTPNESNLKEIILCAFGFNHSNFVDIVYPKYSVTQEFISKKIDKWLSSFIRNEESEKIEEHIKIELLFEKMNKSTDPDIDDDTYIKSSYNSSSLKKIKVLDLLNKKMDRSIKITELTISLNTYFPSLEGDKVTFIGSTFMRLGEKSPYKNHCIVLNSCSPVDNVEIETYDTEAEVLIQWSNLIQRENPDIIIGYNIFGFDYEFMFRRAEENNCVIPFLKLSKNNDEICGNLCKDSGKFRIEETSIHIASGQHDLKYIKMDGRIQIDLYNYFRREENLTSYKLDYVSGYFIGDLVKNKEYNESDNTTIIYTTNITGLLIDSFIHFEEIGHSIDYYNQGEKFIVTNINLTNYSFQIKGHILETEGKKLRWCLAKDDVTPKDIFRLTNGTADDRAIIAKYCIQDCNLVHYLMNKVDIWTGISEMANICSVPINFIILRGQGIKLTSYVAKKCREKDTLIPVMEKSEDDDGYEGAIVLEPKCDLYLDNPVACVDYASLYPSSMMSENISHDSKVWTKEYDLFGNLISETGNSIYDNLLDYEYVNISYDTYKYERKTPAGATNKIKVGKKICRFAQHKNGQRAIMPSILEELLLARKTTKKLIPLQTDDFMKNILDKRQLGYKITANSLYGQCGAKTSTFYEKDCAASTTAVGRMLLTYAKRVIEECYENTICHTSQGPVLTKAEYIYGDSVANYTPVYISSMNQMGIYEVEIIRIDKLIHTYGDSKWIETDDGKEIYIFERPIWTWTDKGWTRLNNVIRHKLSPNKKMKRILTPKGLVDVTDDHSLLTIHGEEISPNDVQIGMELLHYPIKLKENNFNWSHTIPHINSYYDNKIKIQLLKYWLAQRTQFIETHNSIVVIGLQVKKDDSLFYQDHDIHNHNLTNLEYNQELLSEIYLCVTQTFQFDISIMVDCSIIIYPHRSYPYHSSHSNVETIIDIDYQGYVYDLTTENHHFAAGVGEMIVHNTDSVFFTFNLQTPEGEKIRGKKALEITIELAQEAGHLASKFLKNPHDLEYEKTFMPFCLLSKKRYVGMLYETDPNKCKRKEMGIVLKRRDNAPIVKDIYGGIIDILMKKQNIDEAIQFLRTSLRNIIDKQYSENKFIISKSLRSGYKNPQQIAHKVLADRITQRDPGNKPQSGDRIHYLYIHNSNKNSLQGEKIETPNYIKEHNLTIDYSHYITNQIMKPVQQLFSLVLEQIWSKQNKITKITKFKRECEMVKKENLEEDKYLSKIETMKNKEIKILLFDEFLRETNNSKEKNSTITKFFPVKS
jgi:DNA polymerase elongation subunit (family B)